MIEQRATVIDITDKTVLVEAERQSTCNKCQVKQGCGTRLLANHVGKRFTTIAVDKTSAVDIGQQINLAIPEQVLLQGAAVMYLIPMIVMILAALLVSAFQFGEVAQTLAGISGLVMGLMMTRWYLKDKKTDFKVSMLEE